MSSRVVQAMLAKDIPISEIAIPEVIQANLAGADLCDARRSRRMTDKKETRLLNVLLRPSRFLKVGARRLN